METRPIIFLDLDGVVHPVSSEPLPSTWVAVEQEIGRQYFHIPAVGLLNCLCARLDAEIVLISSWRFLGFPLSSYAQIFKHRLVDQTPDCHELPLFGRREQEILMYLERYETEPAFVVIDDQAHHYEMLSPRLVSPESSAGLSEVDVARALEILSDPEPYAGYEWLIEVERCPR